jgi:hypothetical protein
MQIAWETLDLARVVYDKMGKKEKVAEVLLSLGDVSLELGRFQWLLVLALTHPSKLCSRLP